MEDPTIPPRTGSEAFDRTVLVFEHPGNSEIHDHEDATLQIGIDPQDGLPRQSSSAWKNYLTPPLDPSTLLCMEDASRYVLRDAGGHVVATFAPAEVRVLDTGPVVSRATALSRLERRGMALRLAIGRLTEGPDVRVEPLRPQCRHYARQIIDFPGEVGHIMVRRFCRANRTDEGEYESVREVLVFACELRDPRDASSEKQISDFDAERVKLGRQRVREHAFDVASELRQAEAHRASNPSPPPEDPAQGGIFNPT